MNKFYDKKLWDECVDRDQPQRFGKVQIPALSDMKRWPGRPHRVQHRFSQEIGNGWRIYAFADKFQLDLFLMSVDGSVECDREGETITNGEVKGV